MIDSAESQEQQEQQNEPTEDEQSQLLALHGRLWMVRLVTMGAVILIKLPKLSHVEQLLDLQKKEGVTHSQKLAVYREIAKDLVVWPSPERFVEWTKTRVALVERLCTIGFKIAQGLANEGVEFLGETPGDNEPTATDSSEAKAKHGDVYSVPFDSLSGRALVKLPSEPQYARARDMLKAEGLSAKERLEILNRFARDVVVWPPREKLDSWIKVFALVGLKIAYTVFELAEDHGVDRVKKL